MTGKNLSSWKCLSLFPHISNRALRLSKIPSYWRLFSRITLWRNCTVFWPHSTSFQVPKDCNSANYSCMTQCSFQFISMKSIPMSPFHYTYFFKRRLRPILGIFFLMKDIYTQFRKFLYILELKPIHQVLLFFFYILGKGFFKGKPIFIKT